MFTTIVLEKYLANPANRSAVSLIKTMGAEDNTSKCKFVSNTISGIGALASIVVFVAWYITPESWSQASYENEVTGFAYLVIGFLLSLGFWLGVRAVDRANQSRQFSKLFAKGEIIEIAFDLSLAINTRLDKIDLRQFGHNVYRLTSRDFEVLRGISNTIRKEVAEVNKSKIEQLLDEFVTRIHSEYENTRTSQASQLDTQLEG